MYFSFMFYVLYFIFYILYFSLIFFWWMEIQEICLHHAYTFKIYNTKLGSAGEGGRREEGGGMREDGGGSGVVVIINERE